jgi:hypothetical protein
MSARKPKVVKTMNQVWGRLMDYAAEHEQNEKAIAEEFNRMLDTLLGEDFFGTEGQCDPRGDHRD